MSASMPTTADRASTGSESGRPPLRVVLSLPLTEPAAACQLAAKKPEVAKEEAAKTLSLSEASLDAVDCALVLSRA